jgi:hypothetical protein
MLHGTLCLLCGGSAEDALQPLVHLAPTLVESAGNVSKCTAAVATFWLALVKVQSCRSARSTAAVQPASSANLRWRRSATLASTVASSPFGFSFNVVL